MTHVGIREFKDKATTLLSSGETLVVERHGKTVGFYIPIEAKDRSTGRAALEDLENVINGILERTGMTEDELLESESFGLESKPEKTKPEKTKRNATRR